MISIICVGDINLEFEKKLEFEKEIIDIFETGDIRFGNLETVVSDKEGILKEKAINFKVNSEKLNLLLPLKFDILNIANNHILDFGEELKKDTRDNILKYGINVIGYNNSFYDIKILSLKNKKIAFIGIQCFDLKIDPILKKKIKELKKKVDFIILSVHWGEELCLTPTTKQKSIAHQLIENGVDVIIGHHPHVLQGIEKYKNGIIVYSLGNFQFKIEDEDVDLTQYTNILILFLEKDEIKIKEYPIFIKKDGIPSLKLDKKEIKKYEKIKKKCDYYIDNLSYFNYLKEMSRYSIPDSLNSWKIRKKKKEKNYLLKKIRWFLHPKIMVSYLLYLYNKFYNGEK